MPVTFGKVQKMGTCKLKVWRGKEKTGPISEIREYDKDHIFVKEERMPDGRIKIILKNKKTGKISQVEKKK